MPTLKSSTTFRALYFYILVFWAIPLHAQPFQVASGLFNQSLTDDLGLSLATGTTTHTVYKPTATSDKYGNGVVLIGFKGALYCQWQSSAIHEDSTDTWVAFSKSADGITWSAPAVLSPKRTDGITTSGGWWVHGDTLIAYINYWPTGLSPKGGEALYTSSTDGKTWSTTRIPLQSIALNDTCAGTQVCVVPEPEPDPEEPPIQILRPVVQQTPWVTPHRFDLLGRRDF